ncbi:GyrI-like domain-containing protein [Clostridiaceae bacterium M8S5]|nr:GyrI-like domain-containing protein [Clostridiaceae bacterium M8S5]
MNNKLDKKEYISKINLVQDYIENNLEKNLTLDNLSKIANYSPYHFHRLFKNYTRESLYSYIKRLRFEKAAFLLSTDNKKTITQVAANVGFANQASFAKAFKKYFGVNASEYKIQGNEDPQNSKNGQIESNDGKDSKINNVYNDTVKKNNIHEKEKIKPYKFEIKKISNKEVIYVRYIGKYKQDTKLFTTLFNKLYQWAFARDLVSCKTQWLVVYHDIGNLTEDTKLRMSVCMTVDQSVKVEGDIGNTIIEGGKYAIGSFKLDYTEYQQAWDYMIDEWLEKSGFKLSDKPAFEFYPLDNDNNSDHKKAVDIYIPVQPK